MLPVILVAVGAYLIGDSVLEDKKYAKGGMADGGEKAAKKRLEQLRKALRAEKISYGELAELESLKEYIDENDVELRQAAGIPEFEDEDEYAKGGEISKEDIEILGIPRNKITEKEWASILRMAKYQDGATYILKDEKGLDVSPKVEYEWYIKEKMAKGGETDKKYYNLSKEKMPIKLKRGIVLYDKKRKEELQVTAVLRSKNIIQFVVIDEDGNDKEIDNGNLSYIEERMSKGELLVENPFYKGKMADGGEISHQYYVTYVSPKSGYDLYKTNGGDENEDIFIGNYSKLEEAKKNAENKGLERLPMYMKNERNKNDYGRMAKGGKLVGKQKNLDVNKNGKLDAEDFKILRGEKMDKGGVANKGLTRSQYNKIFDKFTSKDTYIGTLTKNNMGENVFLVDAADIETADTIKKYLDDNKIEYANSSIGKKRFLVY